MFLIKPASYYDEQFAIGREPIPILEQSKVEGTYVYELNFGLLNPTWFPLSSSDVLCSNPSYICVVHCIVLLLFMLLLAFPFLIRFISYSFSPSLIPQLSLSSCRLLPLIHSKWSMPLIKCTRNTFPDGGWPHKLGYDLQLSTKLGYVISFKSHIVTWDRLKSQVI